MNVTRRMPAGALATVGTGLVLMFALPAVLDEFSLMQATIYVVMSVLALSLGFVWGYGGILCFGQSAFFGLGAYAYAICAMNMPGSMLPVPLAVLVPAAFAAALGYFMFYGRLSDVYMGVITLTVTLILFNLVNSTAGPEWRIGDAPLGGFNGIPSVPPPPLPGLPEGAGPMEMYYLSFGCLIAVYALLRWMSATHAGQVIVAIRENERRAQLLGYDTRAWKLLVFTVGGAVAGLAGCLFVNWGAFVSPTVFGLSQSAQIIIWVIVGGLGTLVGPIVGCIAIQWLTIRLGTQETLNANLALGAILVAFVLLVPRGIVPTLSDLARKAWTNLRARRAGTPAPAAVTGAGS